MDLHGVEGRRVQRADRCRGAVPEGRITPPPVEDAVAPAEVGVGAVAGVLVPAGDGRRQRLGGNANGVGEPGDGRRLGDPGGRGRGRAVPGETVTGEVVVVENHPGGVVDVLEGGDVEYVEGRSERVVVRGLVGEASSAAVDHDAVRSGPLAVDLPGHDAGHRMHDVDRRHPPGFPHVVQVRADAHGHPQAVTGVGRDGHGAVQRAADERAHQSRIMLEAAGGQDDPAPRTDFEGAGGRLEPDTDHLACLDDQRLRPGLGPRLDAAVQAAAQKGADQPLAGAALVVDPPAGHLLRRNTARCATAQRGLAHHDVAAQLITHAHPVSPRAELIEGKQRALHRASAPGLRAGMLRVVVGEVLDDPECGRRLRLQPRDHLRSGIDIGRCKCGIDQPVRERLQVSQSVLAAVGQAEFGHVGVAGYPDHPPGPGRCAADLRGLFEQAHACPTVMRGERGGQSGGTRTEHDDVEDLHAPALS